MKTILFNIDRCDHVDSSRSCENLDAVSRRHWIGLAFRFVELAGKQRRKTVSTETKSVVTPRGCEKPIQISRQAHYRTLISQLT